ncbi:Protein of unknown function [Paenimyroides aquimaris]|uniref:DUF4199 domain-containing protein n=1 Tax=Paenimyroides marinum TaxID=1159016 RepID=A0A1H6K1V1_9FLAO|nr:DUF4199 domain-containing protein [Paenimyroides aquimaris]SEH65703.1 Protein of unknown function [Paenimyroides aquimaris]
MNKIGIELKWAGIITAFTCLWAALKQALGYHKDFSNILIPAIYYVILTFLWAIAFVDKKKSLGKGAVWEFKSAFKFGLILTGLLTILSPIAQYIIYENISPDYFNNMIEYQMAKGRQTRESLELIHNINFAIRQGVMNSLSLGVIYAALYAWVFKTKSNPNTTNIVVNNTKKRK